jgi:hypothetical protein
MPTFVFSYRSRVGYEPTPESGAAWRAWFDGLGDQVADLGQPVVRRASIGNTDQDSTELGGYSLVTADDIDGALAIAKGCPHLDRSGGVEIGELGAVPGSRAPGS